MNTHETRTTPDLRHYLAVLSRRKWVILPFAVLTPIVVFLLVSSRTALYEASADVLLNRQSQSITGIDDPTLWNPERAVRTQAQLARVPDVARSVVAAARLNDRSAGDFLGQSSVTADGETDLMRFSVSDTDPKLATRLATEYAKQYIAYRSSLETLALRRALRALDAQLGQLRRSGDARTAVYATLADKKQQIQTALTLQASKAILVREASGAGQIAPNPRRSAILALMVALVAGLGLAFLLEAVDLRIRSADELADNLSLPLLARLHESTAHLRGGSPLVMLAAPTSAEAEGYRMLRTNLEFTNLDRKCKTILVTSALDAEGKSTAVANLAIALARAGRRVLVVDLDLRRPSLDAFFGVERRPGISDLLLGTASLTRVASRMSFSLDGGEPEGSQLVRTPSWEPGEHETERPGSNGKRRTRYGTIEVIPAGSSPPNPGELVASPKLETALAEISQRVDLVLIDGPPMLLAGDALTLSAKVDGILVVARRNVVGRPQVRELRRLLASAPAQKLGLVVTDDSIVDGSRGYYDSAPAETPERVPVL